MAYERKTTSLFDSDGSSSCSERSHKNIFRNNDEGSDDDDMATFTVSTVLEKRGRGKPSDNSRRDTITRTMPTISIHDKCHIPAAVEKKQTGQHKNHPEERLQLRVTSSLMDDLSDSDNDGDELRRCAKMESSGIQSKNRYRKGIFRATSQDAQIEVSSSNSTTMRQSTAAVIVSKQSNLLDIELGNGVGTDNTTSSNHSTNAQSDNSSGTFISVYEDLTVNRRKSPKTQAKKRYSDLPDRGTSQVKTLVSTVLKTVANGLAASKSCDGAASWDVEKIPQVSGKKRAIDINEKSEIRYRQGNRRKSLDIRAELTLVQDMMNEKTEECIRLQQQLDQFQSQIQSLQNENSIVLQSKIILETKLGLARKACQAAETNSSVARDEAGTANARVESLSYQLRDSQSKADGLQLDLRQKNDEMHTVKCQLQQTEYELKKTKREKEDAEKERDAKKSRAELQEEIDNMRHALKDIRELERIRVRKTHSTEAELRGARDALAKANSAVAEAESTSTSLRGAMEELTKENGSLRARLKKNKTPDERHLQQWKMEWEEQEEGIEVAAVKRQQLKKGVATPNTANFDNINTLGAEDATSASKQSDHASKLPLKANLRTPDSSSRQLSFASAKSPFPANKENHNTVNSRRPECSLCFRPPRPYGIMKRCQCGRDNCTKWAHASCLVNIKSVSSCVSHPGTPAPPLPTILCDGIWDGK